MRRVAVIILCFLVFSCDLTQENLKETVSLKLSRKELTKLFKGQELFSIRGIKSNFEGTPVRVRTIPAKSDYIFSLDFKKNFYRGSKEVVLHSNLALYDAYKKYASFIKKHRLTWMQMDSVTVEFSDHLTKDFVFIDVPSKETLEYGGNRFLQIFTYNGQFELELSELVKRIDYQNCYDYDYNSLALVDAFLETSKLGLSSFEAIKIVPNTITNKLHFMIDFTYITEAKKGIAFKRYIDQLGNFIAINPKALEKARLDIQGGSEEAQRTKKTLEGEVHLYEDLVLNRVDLTVKANTKIVLHNDADILIDDSRVQFLGEKENGIDVQGLGSNSVVITNSEMANFYHTTFSELSNFSTDCRSMPAAITVYNSNSVFEYCTFEKNKVGDDMINLFQSVFQMEHCLFKDVNSDAVDSDFSSGSIANTDFLNIGNDAVDCSGSRVDVTASMFSKIQDKAISAGENSNLRVVNSSIFDSAIGYVTKDGSSLHVENIKALTNNDLDFAVFTKKTFYSKPVLTMTDQIKNYRYLIEKRSSVTTKDQNYKLVYTKKVESKLYGNEYGKSSK